MSCRHCGGTLICVQEIQALLASWSQQLKACHLIFLRTSTYSRHIFFSGKSPALSKGDNRVRTIPFVTGRPTFNEAKRVHRLLMAAECFGKTTTMVAWTILETVYEGKSPK